MKSGAEIKPEETKGIGYQVDALIAILEPQGKALSEEDSQVQSLFRNFCGKEGPRS